MYKPGPPPVSIDLETFVAAVYQELERISNDLQTGVGAVLLEEHIAPPSKPRERMIVFADGVSWNPGSGKGVYAYYNGAWRFLG